MMNESLLHRLRPLIASCEVSPAALWIGLLASTVLLSGAPLSEQVVAQDGPKERERIEELVDDLGSPKFIERQLAMERLSRMGLEVLSPIKRATTSSDPEVRLRAREILRTIRHDDRQRLINAFIAGVEIESQAELPLWNAYQELVDMTTGARELYVDMLESEWAFLDRAFDEAPAELPTLIARRVTHLEQQAQQRHEIEVGSVAALMLVACQSELEIPNLSNLMTLCYRAEGFDRAVRLEPLGPPLKKMMGCLISRPASNPYLTQRFHFALHYDLEAGLPAARQVVTEGAGIPYVRQYALLVLAKLGTPDDLNLIENLLDDAGVVSSHNRINRVRITTQVRDVALAALIHKTDGDFERYGVPEAKVNSSTLIQPTSIGFATDEERLAAIEKWRRRDASGPVSDETEEIDETETQRDDESAIDDEPEAG